MPNYNILPITEGLAPPEGPKTVAVTIIWSLNPNNPQTVFPISFVSQVQTAQFTSVQAVYVDNSTCPYPVLLQSAETGQMLNVPGFTVGMYPIFSGANPNITVSIGTVGDFTTRLQFFNLRQVPFQLANPILGNQVGVIAKSVQFVNGGPTSMLLYTHPYPNRMSLSQLQIINSMGGTPGTNFGPSCQISEIGGTFFGDFAVGGTLPLEPQYFNISYDPPWISELDHGFLQLTISNPLPIGVATLTIYVNATIGNVVVA